MTDAAQGLPPVAASVPVVVWRLQAAGWRVRWTHLPDVIAVYDQGSDSWFPLDILVGRPRKGRAA